MSCPPERLAQCVYNRMNRDQRKSDGGVNQRIPHLTPQVNLNISLRLVAWEPDVERLPSKRTGLRTINVSINPARYSQRN